MRPTLSEIVSGVWATWPPGEVVESGGFTLRRSGDDSRRSRAANRTRDVTDQEIEAAAARMRDWGQPAMFWVPGDDTAFAAQLGSLGYRDHDHSVYYAIETAKLAASPPPPVTAFEIWEPLAIMSDIWVETGTSLARQEIMAAATCAKTAILGRVDAQPAAAAYVGAEGDVAILQALATRPRHRRKGLAAHVLAQSGIWAARQGCTYLALAVGRDNDPARALYERAGMWEAGTYHYRTKEAS